MTNTAGWGCSHSICDWEVCLTAPTRDRAKPSTTGMKSDKQKEENRLHPLSQWKIGVRQGRNCFFKVGLINNFVLSNFLCNWKTFNWDKINTFSSKHVTADFCVWHPCIKRNYESQHVKGRWQMKLNTSLGIKFWYGIPQDDYKRPRSALFARGLVCLPLTLSATRECGRPFDHSLDSPGISRWKVSHIKKL